MSEQTPVEWEPTKTETPVEEPTKNQPSEADQQTARAISAENKLKEANKRLADIDKAEEEKREAQLEEEKKFEELKSGYISKQESLTTENQTYKEELEKLRTENQAFLDSSFQDAMSKVPESHREKVESIVWGYTWIEKINKIKETLEIFTDIQPIATATPNLWGKGSPTRLSELEAKQTNGTIEPLEMVKLKRLKK